MSKMYGTIIMAALTSAGYKAYFCGGCVRDSLAGVTPKDWDIVTSATPEQVEECLAVNEVTFRIIPVGKSFGVLRVRNSAVDSAMFGHECEVATMRLDGDYSDGRRPDEVRFCQDAYSDSTRRDFTINAMYMSPFAAHSEVLDPHGGVTDLANRLVRTVGNPQKRFSEDYLRMLRAVRFGCKIAGITRFNLDVGMLPVIKANASRIKRISKERVIQELSKMLEEDVDTQHAVILMNMTGLISAIFDIPEMSMDRIWQFPRISKIELENFLAIILQDCLDIADRLRKLKVDNKTRERTIAIVRHMELVYILHRDAGIGKWTAEQEFELFNLHREGGPLYTGIGHLYRPFGLKDKSGNILDCGLGFKKGTAHCSNKPIITGAWVLQNFPLAHGPAIGDIVRAGDIAQYFDEFRNESEAYKWVQSRYSSIPIST